MVCLIGFELRAGARDPSVPPTFSGIPQAPVRSSLTQQFVLLDEERVLFGE
jgi:hypothetical protein